MDKAFILHGWLRASLLWYHILMRSLFSVILRLISYNPLKVFLFSGKSSNKVHLMFLPFLEEFETASRYSWGSACLA